MTEIRTIFFGDSFIECPGLDASSTWPALVEAALKDRFSGQADLVFSSSTANQENTRGALERMQKDVQFAAPDIVVIQYGTNDSTHWLSNKGAPIVSQAAFRANLEEMLDRCRRFGIPRVAFVTNHTVALHRYDINGLTPDQNTAAYDEITRDVARAAGCLVIDIRAACAGVTPGSICQDDLIHVNQAGARLYAEAATPVMGALIDGLIALEGAEVPAHARD